MLRLTDTPAQDWTGRRLARIRLRAARTPRTTEEPDGNEGHWRPATDHQAQRRGRGRGPGDWRGGQGTPGEAQRRRGGDPRRDRRGSRGERRGVRPLLRPEGRGVTPVRAERIPGPPRRPARQ